MMSYVIDIEDDRYIVMHEGTRKKVTKNGLFRLKNQMNFIGTKGKLDLIQPIPQGYLENTVSSEDNSTVDQHRFNFEFNYLYDDVNKYHCNVKIIDNKVDKLIFDYNIYLGQYDRTNEELNLVWIQSSLNHFNYEVGGREFNVMALDIHYIALDRSVKTDTITLYVDKNFPFIVKANVGISDRG